MDFIDVVEQRRAVRQYRPAPIGRPMIERLLETAVLAPSAMNLQPWAFAVVTGVTRIDEYARRAKEHLIAGSALPAQARDMLSIELQHFHHAPVLLARERRMNRRARTGSFYQVLMLAARNEGLGTCHRLRQAWLSVLRRRRN
jgi:nitroreductase